MMLSNEWNRRRYRLYAPMYDLAARSPEGVGNGRSTASISNVATES